MYRKMRNFRRYGRYNAAGELGLDSTAEHRAQQVTA
jgi:hypothetical protein